MHAYIQLKENIAACAMSLSPECMSDIEQVYMYVYVCVCVSHLEGMYAWVSMCT